MLTSRLGDDVLSSLSAFAEASYLDAESRPAESLQVYEPYAAKLPDAAGPFKSMVLANIAFGAIMVGRFADASRWIAEQDRLGEQLGQPRMRLSAATNLGTLAHYRGDLQAARHLLFHCLGGLRELDIPWLLPIPLDQIAQVLLEAGAFEEADSFAHQLIAVSHGLVRIGGIADGHVLRARAELGGGSIELSVDACSEALRFALEVDDAQTLTRLAATVAQVASASGDAVVATELHATAETMNREIGLVLPKHRERELIREQEALRRALGVHAFGAAWQRGKLTRRRQLGLTISRALAPIEA